MNKFIRIDKSKLSTKLKKTTIKIYIFKLIIIHKTEAVVIKIKIKNIFEL